jgi:hypothetical protein
LGRSLNRGLEQRLPMQLLTQPPTAIQIAEHGFG